MKYEKLVLIAISLILSVSASITQADTDNDVLRLQKRWAEVNYQLEGDAQLAAFENLINEADQACGMHQDDAALWIWSGIIKSTYAGAKGGLGALSMAKKAKADLEHAMEIDPDALEGSAYTSLGTLYYSVPGWPVGFGNDDKAEEMLKKALEINPDGIDSNYFYASFLIDEKKWDDAAYYFHKAQQAPARPDRPIADKGRQEEILTALAQISNR